MLGLHWTYIHNRCSSKKRKKLTTNRYQAAKEEGDGTVLNVHSEWMKTLYVETRIEKQIGRPKSKFNLCSTINSVQQQAYEILMFFSILHGMAQQGWTWLLFYESYKTMEGLPN